DRAGEVAVVEALDLLQRRDRLGVTGQERLGLVLLRVLELARERPPDGQHEQEAEAEDVELRLGLRGERQEPRKGRQPTRAQRPRATRLARTAAGRRAP